MNLMVAAHRFFTASGSDAAWHGRRELHTCGMQLPKELLTKVAIGAGVSVLGWVGLTGMAIHEGQQAINELRKPNAFEEYGIWVGTRCDLINVPRDRCPMCGAG
jgi:hypothetical protein